MCKLRFHPLPDLDKWYEGGLPTFLVQSVRAFKPDVRSLEQVKLHLGTDIAFFTKDTTIMIYVLDVIGVVDVVGACLGEVVGVYGITQSAERMKFVPIEISALRGTVAKVRRFLKSPPLALLAAFPA